MSKPKEFASMLSGFLTDYLMAQKNLSHNTLSSYRDTFILLFRFMQHSKGISPEKLKLDDLNICCIQDFLLWLESVRNYSIASRNQRLAAIHSFFRYIIFLYPELILMCQQVLEIPYGRVPQKTIHFLTEEQMKQLLAQPDISSQAGLRDAALMSLLYDSAARVQEFIDLDICDLKVGKSPALMLTGKGRKTRQVPLMDDTSHLLETYLGCIPESKMAAAAVPLFKSHTGKRFTRPGVTHVLQKYSRLAFGESGIGFSVTPHVMRHSKGMHMLHAGITVYYIKEFLGHADLSTTERYYVRADTEMKRKALVKMASPLPHETSAETPVWKGDSDLLDWLKSLG